MTTDTQFMLKRLEILEQEISEIRQKLESKEALAPRETLRGALKDVEISDEEIEEVKQSWMKRVNDPDL